MPPDRAVEFVIELEPGIAAMSKHPYKIVPPELKLLKEQIDMYMEKCYIQPSSSAWGCPTLFMAKKDQTKRSWLTIVLSTRKPSRTNIEWMVSISSFPAS